MSALGLMDEEDTVTKEGRKGENTVKLDLKRCNHTLD